MKQLLRKALVTTTVCVAMLMSSCTSLTAIMDNPPPKAPFGTPDNTQVYNAYNYHSISYIYNCYQGNYIDIEYSKSGQYGIWEQIIFTSDCIK